MEMENSSKHWYLSTGLHSFTSQKITDLSTAFTTMVKKKGKAIPVTGHEIP
jgi:hypothetical protein